MNKVNSLWEEKYRPSTLDEYICDDKTKQKLQEYIDKNDIPHLIFYGDAGSGKTTLAKLLMNNIICDKLYINASDENGIDTVRTKIKNFAAVSSFNQIKIIHLDEGDQLTVDAQDALKAIMEMYSAKTRFIFTTNHIHKFTEPIQSRTTRININPSDKKEVAQRLSEIADAENVEYDVKDIVKIIKEHFPDIRRCIRVLQQNVRDNKLVLTDLNLTTEIADQVVQILLGTGSKRWVEIRQAISDNSVRQFTPIYKYLFNNIDLYSRGKAEEITITLAEHEYYDYFMPDKEINFMACISKILKTFK